MKMNGLMELKKILTCSEDEFKINFKTRNFVLETELQNPVFKLLLSFLKKVVLFDENGDIDDPTILTHIIPKHLVPSHDPAQLQDSVVFQLQHEIATRKTLIREEMPEESTYVAEHGEAIPITGRNNNALANWRNSRIATGSSATPAARGRGRGRGRTRGRTRGTGKTIAEMCTARTRGRGGRKKGEQNGSCLEMEMHQHLELV